ncbi:MAG TPA: 4Fe-4S double cluster binding domain-containing protein [Methanocella sp.]|jgi:epoxyqueuosine reductase
MSPNRKLLDDLGGHGYAARIVSLDHLADLREDIEAGRRNGLYDDGLYREYLGSFVFGPPQELREARSIVIMAVRQLPVQFSFEGRGKSMTALVPPTYLHGSETDRKARETLAGLVAQGGYRVAPAVLPKKLLAVRSGLAAYGRNNVTYVPGMGSFHRLSAFYTDMPCDGDEWHELTMLDRCGKCRLCYTLCPTGAIEKSRFLLHAGRCIVFHNEKPGTVPFPSWLDPSWHNCLVGCMHCQRSCPENLGRINLFADGCVFNAEETGLILAGTPPDRLPASLAKKLEAHDLAGMLDILPRNLAVLFDTSG